MATLLVENAAQAAPAIVLKELGKMALVGTQVAAASGAGTAASASGAGAKAAGGVLAGVKAKIITAVAVAAIGVGSVVTYQQVTAPVQPPDNTITEEFERPSMRRPQGAGQKQRTTRSMPAAGQQPEELTAIPFEPRGYQDTADSGIVEPMAGDIVPQEPGEGNPAGDNVAGYGGYGGYAMGGGAVVGGGQDSEAPDTGEGAMGYGGGYGGGYFFGVHVEDPNAPDSNSPSDKP